MRPLIDWLTTTDTAPRWALLTIEAFVLANLISWPVRSVRRRISKRRDG